MRVFENRAEAGRALIPLLRPYVEQSNTVVLALPRGGVPVAYEIASALDLPLDVFVVRKLGALDQPEFALGAIASGGAVVINPEAKHYYIDLDAVLTPIVAMQQLELQRCEQLYRHDHPALAVDDRMVMVIDDGAATGATMRAAVQALRRAGADAIIAGLPVCASEASEELQRVADRVICVETPRPFFSVGHWYQAFEQTSDIEVCNLLTAARNHQAMTARLKEAHIGSR